MEELANGCRELGLEGSDDPYRCLERLERLLANVDENRERKDRARGYLERVRDTTEDVGISVESTRILLAYRDGLQTTQPRQEDEPWRRLVAYDDPQWIPWVARLSEQTDPGASRAFGRHLTSVLQNALQWTREPDVLLRSLKPLVESALERLGEQMDVGPRNLLKRWRYEIIELEQQASAEEWVARLQGLYEKHDWSGLKVLLPEAGALALSEEQRRRVGQIQVETDAYFTWKDSLEHVVHVLNGFKSSLNALLPWPNSMPVQQIRVVNQGMGRWGSDADQKTLNAVFEQLARSATTSLAQAKEEPESRLEAIELAYRLWDDVAPGETPATGVWRQALDVVQNEVDTRFTRWAAHIRQTYDGRTTVTEPPAHGRLSAAACGERDKLYEDIELFQDVSAKLNRWEHEGALELLESLDFLSVGEQLENVSAAWGDAPVYRGLTKRLQVLTEELKRIGQAREVCKLERFDEALRLLDDCTLPLAKPLRESASRLALDIRMTTWLYAGEWHKVEAAGLAEAGRGVKELYRKMQGGRVFLQHLEPRYENLDRNGPFDSHAEKVLDLLKETEDAGLAFSGPDQLRLRRFREETLEALASDAEKQVRNLSHACTPYPLIPAERLDILADSCTVLRRGLGLAGMAAVGVEELLRRLDIIGAILSCHRHCHKGDWTVALASVEESSLRQEVRQGLQATVRVEQLRRERAPDSEWLRLYLEMPDILLQHPPDRIRYLGLVRSGNLATESLATHARLLENHFPEARFLALLIKLAANPQRTDAEVGGRPEAADMPVLGLLLERFADDCSNNELLARLWGHLEPGERLRCWAGTRDPFDRQRQRFNEQVTQLKGRMEDPQESFFDIRARLQQLQEACGQEVDRELVKRLDDAVVLERCIEDLARQDPWVPETQSYVRHCEGLRGRLPIELDRTRSWGRLLGGYEHGFRGWNELDSQWELFRDSFDRLDTLFFRDPEAWAPFVTSLARWHNYLSGPPTRDLDWGLPRARESRRWRSLKTRWEESPEGRLCLGSGLEPPGDTEHLGACYNTVLTQMREFEVLHRALLDRHGDLPNPAPLLLGRLRDCKPLSFPVQRIRQFLMDPEVSEVGVAYRSWITAQS